MTSTDEATPEITVVGAGVIGLTTALVLTEAGHRVRVVADRTGARTTSYAAGAMVSPAFGSTDPRMDRWAAVTRSRMLELAGDPSTGVHVVPTVLASRMELPTPPEADQLDDLVELPRADLPAGFATGMRVPLPFVAMPTYLDWLTAQVRGYGVQIIDRQVAALRELDDTSTIVNCSGLGARALASDEELTADRGQHLVVRNPGLTESFYEVTFGDPWASWMVHGDVVVLGGLSQPGNEDRDPDPEVAAGILARCTAVEPRFADAEVLEHRVGLRPARSAVRLEDEDHRDVQVIHCYGHGGMGVALSYGCALDVLALVR